MTYKNSHSLLNDRRHMPQTPIYPLDGMGVSNLILQIHIKILFLARFMLLGAPLMSQSIRSDVSSSIDSDQIACLSLLSPGRKQDCR